MKDTKVTTDKPVDRSTPGTKLPGTKPPERLPKTGVPGLGKESK